MTDQAKRRTLKNVAAIGVSTAAFVASPGVLAHGVSTVNHGTSAAARTVNAGLVDMRVGARQSPETNDLEIVITNTSTTEATITSMTPAEINTVRGRFDFNALFQSGNLHLNPGESVSVPMQHHAVVLDSSRIDERAIEITQILRQNVSIITNGDSFAATTIANFSNFA